TVSILIGDGAGNFAAGADIPLGFTLTNLAAGELNGDSNLDLAVTGFSGLTGKLAVVPGNGNGTFGLASITDVGGKLTSVVIADLNGLNGLDLVVADSAGNQIDVLLGVGNGAFGTPIPLAVGAAPIALAVGQLDGSSPLDLVIANQGSNSFSVALGD